MKNYSTASHSLPLSKVRDTNQVDLLCSDDYVSFMSRYVTFLTDGWNNTPNAFELARAGFICRNQRDQVQCFICNVVIEGWSSCHSPIDQHRLHSPNCPLLIGYFDDCPQSDCCKQDVKEPNSQLEWDSAVDLSLDYSDSEVLDLSWTSRLKPSTRQECPSSTPKAAFKTPCRVQEMYLPVRDFCYTSLISSMKFDPYQTYGRV